MNTIDVRDYVDLRKFPLHDRGSALYDAVLRTIREELDGDGCAVLRGFVRRDRIAALVAEADRVAPYGYRSFSRTNAYFTQDDPGLPHSHPVRRFFDRSNAFIPADNFGPESILRAIYRWPPFAPFIQAALNEEKFYPYADPLADVIINMSEEGGGFPWHFDTNNYTVTLAIQNGEDGGAFEYCPHLRSAEDERYDAVQAVLDGDRSPVKSLWLEPGDLQIFRGRHTLHRVEPMRGTRTRYVAIFSYAEHPHMVGSPERTRQLYGRTLPIHERLSGVRQDTLLD